MSITAAGKTAIKVNTGTIADGDSIASYLVDSAGALLTSTLVGSKQRLDVQSSAEYAEDSAHTSGDYGQFVMAVRNDAGTALAADGDYIPFTTDATGAIRVAGTFTANEDYIYDEDSAAADGDKLAGIGAVRQDTLSASTSADGDWGWFKQTNVGELYVKDSAAGTSLASILTELQNLSHAEDAAHTSGDLGIQALSRRIDAPASSAGASGDYATLDTNALGELRTVNKAESSILQQIVTVGTTAVALPTTALTNRKNLMVQMLSGGQLYIGSATVTNSGSTRGVKLGEGGFVTLDVGPTVSVYGIANAAGKDVAVLEMA